MRTLRCLAWRVRVLAVLVLVLGGVFTSLALPASASSISTTQLRLAQTSLQTRITAILVNCGLARPGTAVRVWDRTAGVGLYARNVSTLLTPASNEKLVTSAAALALWGPEHRFTTRLYLSSLPAYGTGVVHGNVYLQGGGDPSLSSGWYQTNVLHITTANISHFAKALKSLGVTKIVGRVVGDESYFDTQRAVASWRPGMTQWCGPLSALSLNEGYDDGTRVAHPALFTVRRLTKILERNGIVVTGSAAVGRVPATAVLCFTEQSAPLATLIKAMNKPSDNFFAEMLTKDLGAAFGGAGTTAAGVAVEAKFLRSEGVAATSFRLCDGSGLSYQDKLTAGAVTRLLRQMAGSVDYPYYWASLPVAARSGTLIDRMRNTAAAGNVHAKTGTLAIASCLSGYVTTANGHQVVFSILMNHSCLNIWRAEGAQDAIAVALAKAAP